MKTEAAAQQFWNASLSWRGRAPTDEGVTVEGLFTILRPIEIHQSFALARQATELSDMIVKCKRSRCPKPRKQLTNLVTHPTLARLQAAGEPGMLFARR